MKITQAILDEIIAKAKERFAYSGSGSVMPIYRYLASSETVVLLRGKICWHFYDDAGNETESVVLDANGDVRCINVEKARWHSLECLESGSVLYESKDGPYHPLEEDEIMVK